MYSLWLNKKKINKHVTQYLKASGEKGTCSEQKEGEEEERLQKAALCWQVKATAEQARESSKATSMV
jgi:hypothetical protein